MDLDSKVVDQVRVVDRLEDTQLVGDVPDDQSVMVVMIILNDQNDIIYSMIIINMKVPDDQNVMVVIIVKDFPGDQMILSFL